MSSVSAATEYARQQMVRQQVRTWDILDVRILDALRTVPREEFAPAAYRHVAFADDVIPLGHGQGMLPPKIDGKILQALALSDTDKVLDVGSGSGFLAACFGRLAGQVRSLEVFPDLAEQARMNLQRAAANNVAVEIADVFSLAPSQLGEQRYDAIAISGSLPMLDERFANALQIGGRLFAVVGSGPVMTALKIVRTAKNQLQQIVLFETNIAPLLNAPRPSSFVF